MTREVRTFLVAATAASALALAAATWGADAGETEGTPTVEEVVKRANEVSYYQGGTGRARVKLTITDAKGRPRGERAEDQAIDTDPDQIPAAGHRIAGEHLNSLAERVVQAGRGVDARPQQGGGDPPPNAIPAAIIVHPMHANREQPHHRQATAGE